MPKNKNRKNIFSCMSINRSQAEALADQFVDSISDDEDKKSDLQPKETFTELFLLAGEFVEDAQDNLKASNSNASGKLSGSLKLVNPEHNGSVVSVDVEMNFYGKFVNAGVKGTKSGRSTEGYAFKNPYPNRRMARALMIGIGMAKKRSTNVNKAKSTSQNEIKNKTISEIDSAYGAARNIKMYGIKPTGFIDKAVVTTANKVQDRLGAAFRIDILNSI